MYEDVSQKPDTPPFSVKREGCKTLAPSAGSSAGLLQGEWRDRQVKLLGLQQSLGDPGYLVLPVCYMRGKWRKDSF